jgi:acetyl esterase/lipase
MISLACWCSLAASDAQPTERASDPPRALVERLVRDSLRSWETGDVDLFLSTMHEDVTFAYPGERMGAAGALEVFRFWRENYENTRIYIHSLIIDGPRFAAEYQYATTRKDSGKRSAVGTVATGIVKDGKLYVVKEYLDGRVSRLQDAGELPLEEGQEPFPWPLSPKAKEADSAASPTADLSNPPPFPPLPASIEGAQTLTYKARDGFSLPLFLFQPTGQRGQHATRPAIVFFHGSGWHSGTVLQFAGYARLLAERGMVAALAEYRVKEGYDATPFDSVADAKSAIRWLRSHAGTYGIDSHRVVAAGGSAGGHIAISAAIFDGKYDDPNDDRATSARPDAVVLFAPVLDTTITGYSEGVPLFGGRELELSPVHHLKKRLPPTLVFTGTSDEWVPYESVKRYEAGCLKLNNACELVAFAGRNHHFYNDPSYFELRPHLGGPYSSSDFLLITYVLERFLYKHGLLQQEPVVPARPG